MALGARTDRDEHEGIDLERDFADNESEDIIRLNRKKQQDKEANEEDEMTRKLNQPPCEEGIDNSSSLHDFMNFDDVDSLIAI